jgi:DNA-binding SARP family transcriptional activator
MSEELRLTLLGSVQITQGATPVTGFISSKVQALLCYLAVSGRPHTRSALAGLLWGDMPEDAARVNLRQAIANLRRLVAPHLIITRQTLAFDWESPYWLDVEVFSQGINKALGHSTNGNVNENGNLPTSSAIASLTEAVELYQGEFLEGFQVRDALAFEEWVLLQRERFRGLALQGLHMLSTYHASQGEAGSMAGIRYTKRLLRLEPWSEEAHRQLMELLARSGQRGAALVQYKRCCEVLAAEFSLQPMAETTALFERIRAAEPVASLKSPLHQPLLGG